MAKLGGRRMPLSIPFMVMSLATWRGSRWHRYQSCPHHENMGKSISRRYSYISIYLIYVIIKPGRTSYLLSPHNVRTNATTIHFIVNKLALACMHACVLHCEGSQCLAFLRSQIPLPTNSINITIHPSLNPPMHVNPFIYYVVPQPPQLCPPSPHPTACPMSPTPIVARCT